MHTYWRWKDAVSPISPEVAGFEAHEQYCRNGRRPSPRYRRALATVEQVTDEWKYERLRFQSASQNAAAAGLSPHVTQWGHYQVCIGKAAPEEWDAMQQFIVHRGSVLESGILAMYMDLWRDGRLRSITGDAEPPPVRHEGMALDAEMPWFSASPDSLVGDDGGAEIKCRTTRATLAKAFKVVPPQHMAQIQTCMRVYERRWWDLVSYWRKYDPVPGSKKPYPSPGHESELAVTRAYFSQRYWDEMSRVATRFVDAVVRRKLSDAGHLAGDEVPTVHSLSTVRRLYHCNELPEIQREALQTFVPLSDAVAEHWPGNVVLSDEDLKKEKMPVPPYWSTVRVRTDPVVLIDDVDRGYCHHVRDQDLTFP